MNTSKIYKDSKGNYCTINQIIKREPEWAANRIQEGEKAIEKLSKQKPLSEEEILSILRNELGIKMKDCGIFKAFCMYVEKAHGIG